VSDHLTRCRTGSRKAEAVDDTVKAGLKNLQHLLTGNAAAAKCLLIYIAELALLEPIKKPQLLLFEQTKTVVCGLAT
jgi:hypothetical protein